MVPAPTPALPGMYVYLLCYLGNFLEFHWIRVRVRVRG